MLTSIYADSKALFLVFVFAQCGYTPTLTAIEVYLQVQEKLLTCAHISSQPRQCLVISPPSDPSAFNTCKHQYTYRIRLFKMYEIEFLPSASTMGYGQQAGGTHSTGMHSCPTLMSVLYSSALTSRTIVT